MSAEAKALFDSDPGFDLPIGFAGGLRDPLTGFVRFGLRDYDPQAARWLSRDPLMFSGGQGNLFAYVGNDPVNLKDPSGRAVVIGAVLWNPDSRALLFEVLDTFWMTVAG